MNPERTDVASLDDVVDTLRMATDEGRRVRPVGGGGWMDAWGLAGPVPAPPDITLGLGGLDEVVEYEPADLTMTVGAGITLDRISELARPNGQWLAADPRHRPDATLGATVVTASQGPLRSGYGSMRDHVLGMTVVTGDGRVLELGGRVVKNVAGFDLLKLMVGGWGRFGVSTQVTIRLHPLPTCDITLMWSADDLSALALVGRSLATAPVVPAALRLECDGAGARLLARVVGGDASAPVEVDLLSQAVTASAAPSTRVEGDESVESWRAHSRDAGAATELEVSFRPADLISMVPHISAARTAGWRIRCDVTEGICQVETDEAVLDPILEWSRGGAVRVLRANPPDRARLAERHEPIATPVRQLVDRLMRSFDPAGVLG